MGTFNKGSNEKALTIQIELGRIQCKSINSFFKKCNKHFLAKLEKLLEETIMRKEAKHEIVD